MKDRGPRLRRDLPLPHVRARHGVRRGRAAGTRRRLGGRALERHRGERSAQQRESSSHRSRDPQRGTGRRHPDPPVLARGPAPSPDGLTDLIRTAHSRSTTVVGLCLGAFPLAEAGALEGRSAVTHWSAAGTFAGRFPRRGRGPVRSVHRPRRRAHVSRDGLGAGCLPAHRPRAARGLGGGQGGAPARHRAAPRGRTGPVRRASAARRRRARRPGRGDRVGARAPRPLRCPSTTWRSSAHMSRRNFTRRFQEVTGTGPAAWVRSTAARPGPLAPGDHVVAGRSHRGRSAGSAVP